MRYVSKIIYEASTCSYHAIHLRDLTSWDLHKSTEERSCCLGSLQVTRSSQVSHPYSSRYPRMSLTHCQRLGFIQVYTDERFNLIQTESLTISWWHTRIWWLARMSYMRWWSNLGEKPNETEIKVDSYWVSHMFKKILN